MMYCKKFVWQDSRVIAIVVTDVTSWNWVILC